GGQLAVGFGALCLRRAFLVRLSSTHGGHRRVAVVRRGPGDDDLLGGEERRTPAWAANRRFVARDRRAGGTSLAGIIRTANRGRGFDARRWNCLGRLFAARKERRRCVARDSRQFS